MDSPGLSRLPVPTAPRFCLRTPGTRAKTPPSSRSRAAVDSYPREEEPARQPAGEGRAGPQPLLITVIAAGGAAEAIKRRRRYPPPSAHTLDPRRPSPEWMPRSPSRRSPSLRSRLRGGKPRRRRCAGAGTPVRAARAACMSRRREWAVRPGSGWVPLRALQRSRSILGGAAPRRRRRPTDRPPLPLPVRGPHPLSRDLPPRPIIGRAAANRRAARPGGGGRSHLHSGARPRL